MIEKHTPGPWPWKYTGDGKRIVIGAGLVEGPHGYEVAEVYSDDCPQEVAEANARLIAAAPELLKACQQVIANLREIERTGVATVRRDQMIVVLVAAIAKATSND